MSRILVIKLGALGDFVQALGPMAAIRRHHADARITLLTTRPFVELAEASPYFDAIWPIERHSRFDLAANFRLRQRLRGGRFTRVYDLQTSDRSSWYFALMAPNPPEWSGIARFASHPHANPDRNRMHTIDRQRDQLAMAGIADVEPPDLSWATADLGGFGLRRPYLLLVPGGSAHRPAKRWPIGHFVDLATEVARHGIQIVVVGGPDEAPLGSAITAAVPGAIDLSGRTNLLELAALGREARWAVGNDTGPIHVMAAAGAATTVLYSAASDPTLTAPRGDRVVVLQRPDLADLSVAEVAATLRLS